METLILKIKGSFCVKIYLIAAIIVTVLSAYSQAYAQQPQLATFQEQAQIIIDNQISHNATASIALITTSNQEIKIPTEFEKKVLDEPRVVAIIVTNEERCVLGVIDQSCVMINVKRDPQWKGVIEIQDKTKEIADSLIQDINKIFDINARFHSVIIHQNDDTNVALDTSGIISGRGAISAVYTMPMESTDSMFEKLSAILIPKAIRDSDGFYKVALNLSDEQHAKMTFSMIPSGSSAVYQLKVSVDYPNYQFDGKVEPLKFLKIDKLERSNYFSGGFYPINSLLHVVILSENPEEIQKVNGKILPSQIVQGEKVPTDLTISGWIFDPDSGKRIEGKYLFGKEFSINKDDLVFTLSSYQEPPDIQLQDTLIIIPIIAVAAGAAIYYLKGYKKS